MPAWVIDYVLLHELAHLLEPGHTPAFWAMVDQLPRAERAKGFLEGAAATARWAMTEDDVSDSAPSSIRPAQPRPAEADQLGQ